ncbi:ThuA domain-containing protein [Nibricoccus aquaticus]|nr:ThuA domain-containing protein [Nibricoccus aquaticus]
MSVQVFCDDRFHPAATVREGLAPLGRDWSFVWTDNVHEWKPESLADFPAVILSKSNTASATDWSPWLVGGKETAFRDYVRAGGGLLIVHSGCASYAQVEPMRAVTGGAFTHHPPACEVTIESTDDHALTAGVDARFSVFDEHYFVTLDDLDADVFLRSRSSHGMQPSGWTRREGAGRVCVLTPGHFAQVWLHPSFQKLLANALRWVSAS